MGMGDMVLGLMLPIAWDALSGRLALDQVRPPIAEPVNNSKFIKKRSINFGDIVFTSFT